VVAWFVAAACSGDEDAPHQDAAVDHDAFTGAADATASTGGTSGSGGARVADGGAATGGEAATGGSLQPGSGGALVVVGGAEGGAGDAHSDSGSSNREGGIDAPVDGGHRDGSVEDAGGGPDAAIDASDQSWIQTLFPASRPATISLTATIRQSDLVCVIVYGGGQCQALNNPPCNPSSRQRTVTLDLTLDQNDQLVVEAPYQDMCAPDYFCAVSGPGCPIPTSYAVPTDTTYLFAPRSTDRCRRHQDGTPYDVENVVNVRFVGTTLIIDQLCTTHMLNLTSEVVDVRDWTTTIEVVQ
jgi:hypothetical protein